jgi:hypothetical protein
VSLNGARSRLQQLSKKKKKMAIAKQPAGWPAVSPLLLVAMLVMLVPAVLAAPIAAGKLQITALGVDDLSPEEITFGVICMVTGLGMCFAGYFLFKPLIFCAGFYMGYWICYIIMENIDVDYGANEDLIIFFSSVGAGLLFGLLLIFVIHLGIFILGCLAGFFVAIWILSLVDPTAPIQEDLWRWLLIGGMALVCGVISLVWQKPLIIFSSSLVGSYLLYYGIDTFAQTGFAQSVELILKGQPPSELETEEIIMLIAALATAIIGIFFQFRTTRNRDHRQKTKDAVYVQING